MLFLLFIFFFSLFFLILLSLFFLICSGFVYGCIAHSILLKYLCVIKWQGSSSHDIVLFCHAMPCQCRCFLLFCFCFICATGPGFFQQQKNIYELSHTYTIAANVQTTEGETLQKKKNFKKSPVHGNDVAYKTQSILDRCQNCNFPLVLLQWNLQRFTELVVRRAFVSSKFIAYQQKIK